MALLVNQRTLVPVFLPLAPANTLLRRAPAAVAEVLGRLGADEAFTIAELAAMAEVVIAPTNDRSVVGVMNGFALHGGYRVGDRADTLTDLSVDLAGMPLGPLRDRHGFPDRELAAVLGIEAPPRRRRLVAVGGESTPRRAASRVYQLVVTLADSDPPVWRRLLVDAEASLDQLHEVLQAAFGWWNYHLYEFEVGRTHYGIPDPDGDGGEPPVDARRTRLADVAAARSLFTYTYDFGDNWRHVVEVEAVLHRSPVASLPACVDGRRAGPPEDCGGVWGYEELLEILADPAHPEHAARAEWRSRGAARSSTRTPSTPGTSPTTSSSCGPARSTDRRRDRCWVTWPAKRPERGLRATRYPPRRPGGLAVGAKPEVRRTDQHRLLVVRVRVLVYAPRLSRCR